MILILEQVAQELASILAARQPGRVTIHVGRDDLYVEVERKHRYDPVRVNRPKPAAR